MPTTRDLEAKDPSILLARIKSEFPEVIWHDYTYLNHGWDHEVIILDKTWVFRFPNSHEYLKAFKYEAELLDLVASKCQIAIPQYKYVAKDHSFGGYKLIDGIELSEAVFAGLTKKQTEVIAIQIASFLTTMHTFKLSDLTPFNLRPERYMDDYTELKSRVAEYLPSMLSTEEYKTVQKILQEVDLAVMQQSATVLIHGDLTDKHILWNEVTEAVGIIDFSDRLLGDPALDFAELCSYGEDFLATIYKLYDGPKDPGLLHRAKVFNKRIGVFLLVDSFLSGKISFDSAKQIFDKATKPTI